MRTVSSAVRAPAAPVVMREIPNVAVLMVVGSSPPTSTSPDPEPAGQAAAKSVAPAQPLAVAADPATYAPSGSWSGAVTANAFDDDEPSTAETFASQVDLSVPTVGEVSLNRRARLVGCAAAVVGWVAARASYVARSKVTQNAPEQVFWGAGAAAWTGWTSVAAPMSSATAPAAGAVRRVMGF